MTRRNFSPVAVHSLICRHCQADDLILLADEKNCHPHEVEGSVEHDPTDPRLTRSDDDQRRPQPILNVDVANVSVKHGASVKHPNAHRAQHHEKADEEFVVFGADAVPDLEIEH